MFESNSMTSIRPKNETNQQNQQKPTQSLEAPLSTKQSPQQTKNTFKTLKNNLTEIRNPLSAEFEEDQYSQTHKLLKDKEDHDTELVGDRVKGSDLRILEIVDQYTSGLPDKRETVVQVLEEISED